MPAKMLPNKEAKTFKILEETLTKLSFRLELKDVMSLIESNPRSLKNPGIWLKYWVKLELKTLISEIIGGTMMYTNNPQTNNKKK